MDKKKNPLDMYQQVWDETKAQKQPWRTALNNYQQAYTQMKQQGIMPSTNAPSQVSVETPQETRSLAPNARVKQVQRSNAETVAPTETQASETQVSEPQASETKERPILTGTGNSSLSAPEGLENDQMSGFRGWANDINKYYGGNILTYDPSTLDAEGKKKYYEDYGLYNTVYSAISNYDAEVLAEQKKAKEAAEYANTRRLLMERYLPETIRAMGYANTGLAADAMTGIDAAYQNYALNAKENANEAQNDAMRRYQQAVSDYQAGKVAEQKKAQEEKMQAQEGEYSTYLAAIMDDPSFDTKQLDTALAIGNISQSQYDALIAKYNEVAKAPAPTENEGMKTLQITDMLDQSGIDMAGKTVQFVEGGWTSEGFDKEGFTPAELASYSQSILERHNDTDSDALDEVLELVSAGKKIPNGTIFDINEGKGVDLIVYWNGRFYPVKEVETQASASEEETSASAKGKTATSNAILENGKQIN